MTTPFPSKIGRFTRTQIAALQTAVFIVFIMLSVLLVLETAVAAPAAPTGSCASQTNGNWSDAATWVGTCSGAGGIPAATDNVTVSHLVTLTANSSVTTGSVTVQSGGTLNLSSFALTAATLTIQNSGEVQQGGNGTAPSGTIATRDYQTGSTYTFNGTQAGLSGTHPTYYNLNYIPTPTGAGTFALNLNILNDLTIGLGAAYEIRFATTTNSRTHNIGGDLIVQNNGTVVGNNGSTATANVTIGGDLMVSPGTTFRGTNDAGNANFTVGGNVTNNGTWQVDDGTSAGVFAFTLNGSSTKTISGNPITLDNLTIANTASVVIPVDTSVTNLLTNNGRIQQTRDVSGSGNVTFLGIGSYGGVILNANSSDLGSTTVIIRGNQVCDTDNSSVRRCFDIDPANKTGRNATVSFFWHSTELGSQACSTMNAYHWNGTAWDTPLTLDTSYGTNGRICTDPGLQSLRVTGVTTFSPFVMSSGAAGPTAVSLQSFTSAANPTLPLLLATMLVVLLLGGTLFIWQRSRR